MLVDVLDISKEVQLEIFQKEVLSKEVRYEQVGNIIYLMAFPTETHQDIIMEFLKQLGNYLEDKPCKVYPSVTGLNLSSYVSKLKEKDNLYSFFNRREEKDYKIILDPDIMVICDGDRFKSDHDSDGFKVVPKLIVEVVSPSTGTNDFSWKKNIYESVGVQEYWIIDKDKKQIIRFNLKEGRYSAKSFLFEDIFEGISSLVFSDLIIKFNKNKFDGETSINV